MKLFGFFSLYIIAIFCSYSKEFTINPGQFRFITTYDGEYSNKNTLNIGEGNTFSYLINKLIFKAKNGSGKIKDGDVSKKILEILDKEDLFLAKNTKTGNLSIVSAQDAFKEECHKDCEFIFRDRFFDLGAIEYKSLYHIIDKDYKRKFLEIVLNYANGNFKNWNEFSGMLRNFIREVLQGGKLNVYKGDKDQLDEMKDFVGKNDKFFINFLCCCSDFSGERPILDIKNFLTEVDRKKFTYGDFRDCGCLEMYIRGPEKLSFHSSDQDYAIKKDICKNIQICNFFEYNKDLNSGGIKKLLKGNDYDIFQQDAELSFIDGYTSSINVKTKNLNYVDKRPKIKLNFTYDHNIFKYVDKNTKILEKEEIYLDELDYELGDYKDSLKYDKTKFKDKGIYDIKIIKPIKDKVEYVKKNVKFGLYWNLKEIYGLKTDEKTVKKEFQIDATSTLKSVLDVFFKQLNGLVKNAENIRPESYVVFDSGGIKIDPKEYDEYKILKDEEFTIKLDIFDEKYFEKKDCSRKLIIQIGGYKEKKDGITYIKVPIDDKFETFFKENNNEELLKKMLKEELQEKVFTNSKNIEFGYFYPDNNVVKLSIKNLAEEDIKETQFVTNIDTKVPKYFKEKEHISIFECNINKDSTLVDAIKNIVEEIKKELKKELKDPVFESIKYGDGGFSKIDIGSKITPCSNITLKFEADEKINKEYISEQFPVQKEFTIELKQDYNCFVLKENVKRMIEEISPVKLHEDATCKDFLEKVAQGLKDKTKAENKPALSFEKKINEEELVSEYVDLCLYLDPFNSREYVEDNKKFEGVLLFFNLKCGINNYKLKKEHKDGRYLRIKNIVNDKTTIEGLKEALEEQLEIGPKQCRIYGKENKEFKANDIIADKEEVVVEIIDSSLDKYLIPSKEMTFTIEYVYSKDAYKLKDNAPNKVTALIAEEDLNKNIENFIKDHIIETIKSQNKGISNIYPYSLNNVKWNSNEEVKGFINGNEEDIVVLELFEGCNLLEQKVKLKIEEPKKIGKKEVHKKEEENKEEEKQGKNQKETTLKCKGMENHTPGKKPEKKPVREPGKKSGKTTLKGEGVKNSTEDNKGCCKKCCKSKQEVKSTEKKGCCCSRN